MECSIWSTEVDPEFMNLCACCERPVCDDCVHLNAYGEPINRMSLTLDSPLLKNAVDGEGTGSLKEHQKGPRP